MRIGNKLTLTFLVIALIVGLLGYIVVVTSKNVLQQTIGENSVYLVANILDKIDRHVYGKIETIQVYTQDLILQRAVLKSNREFDNLQNAQAYIDNRDQEWVSTPKKEITPFMQELMNNSLAKELKEKIEFYKDKFGYNVFAEIFATNKYGVNVAQTGRTSDYRQNDELWWKNGERDTLFVADVNYDESANVYSIDISVRINDENGDFAGILKSVMNITEIVSIVEEAEALSKYETAEFKLFTNDGKLIYSTEEFEFLKDLSDGIFSRFKEGGKHRKSFIAEGDNPGESEELFAHAHSKGYKDFKGLGWILVGEYETREIFAPIKRLKTFIFIITFILAVLAVLIGTITSRTISRPLKNLQDAMAKVSNGNLNIKVGTDAKDEIGQLSRAFNKMAGQIKEKNKKLAASKDRAEYAVGEINDVIMKVAGGDFSVQTEVSDINDIYDSLAMGVNMMTDDIKSTINERIKAEDKLKALNQQLEASEQQQKSINRNLHERMKELHCLYEVSRLVEEGKSLDELLQIAVELLPPAWRYPEITCAKIVIGGQVYRTRNYNETEWNQTADIIASGKKMGAIEVSYLTEKPEVDEGPFLKEERALINGLARKLGIIIERNQAEEALKQKNQEILDFSGAVTHDLKKPLTTIKTIYTLMGNEAFCKLNDDGREAMATGREAMSYMQELLDDLLDCAKMEAGTHKFEREKIDIEDIVQQVLGRLKYQVEEKNVTITTDNINIRLNGDRKGLTKIFMNLVGNAVSYIGNGQESKISIGCSKKNNDYEFYISDNGLGIPEEARKNIFQKFKRGSNVTGISGTGLGLAIVKASVEAHNGKIWLESKEGEGTAFYFTIPNSTV